ncbi:MAG TPA: tripartite tricarboxylate transporter substrate binding protein [Burkholderiales bacterium]|nr:tripartite tricarboxylate transporter substrate binding protein [Burkholderiales bacterium]
MDTSLKNSVRLVVMLAACAAALPAGAQAYPTKPIRLIVPFPPGGANDIVARTVNTRLPALLGQSLIIDNRAGAGGNIGTDIAAKSPADGYTLLIANNALTANLSLYAKLPYDPFKDFVPIAMGATSPNMVVVHPSLPARNIKELVALAKARAGAITFASPGPGTPSHLAGELFRARTGADILHVPYKGAGPLMVDQIGGHVMLSFTAPIVSRPHVESGKLRALAVTTEKRWSGMPDLPTVAEAGYPGFDVFLWVAFFAPAGTPREIVDMLATNIERVLQSQDIKDRFAGQGIESATSTPQALAAFLRKEFDMWDKLIKERGIKLD